MTSCTSLRVVCLALLTVRTVVMIHQGRNSLVLHVLPSIVFEQYYGKEDMERCSEVLEPSLRVVRASSRRELPIVHWTTPSALQTHETDNLTRENG